MKACDLGELLRMLRGKGMSQQELADMLFVDRSIVSRIENGHFTPDLELVIRWTDVTHQNWQRMMFQATKYEEVQAIMQGA